MGPGDAPHNLGRGEMRRLTILLVAVVAIVAVTAGSAAAKPRQFNGKIVTSSDNLSTGYTAGLHGRS
jgi:hypothetical protein